MIVFDGVYMMASTLSELHRKAAAMGLTDSWFQDSQKHPHYDVWGNPKASLMADPDVVKFDSTKAMLRFLEKRCC